MGHFSQSCKLSGLPITGGSPVALFPMVMSKHLYDNSEDSIRKYGKTSMVSNDGPRLKFIPCMFPILGNYDDYGGIEDIIEDDNTKVIEDYYGLTIQQVVNIITSNRKDDGYDDSLTLIKKEIVYPEDWVKGEEHFDRFQRITKDKMPPYPDSSNGKFRVSRKGKMVETTKEEYDADFKLVHEHYARYKEWTKTNPNYDDDYGNPQYEEKYKDLLTISGMWIHGDIYKGLTETAKGDYFDKLDLGTPGLLKSLGFKHLESSKKSDSNRYYMEFEKDGQIINSDGTWIDANQVYDLKGLQKYCETKGITIDISEQNRKGRHEQIFDYVIPDSNFFPENKISGDTLGEMLTSIKSIPEKKLIEIFGHSNIKEIVNIIIEDYNNVGDNSRMKDTIIYSFLNTDGYSTSKITNPITKLYYKAAKEGKLKENYVRFWTFDSYMYDCGKFYDIVGTSPQDGEHKNVLKVLELAVSILKPIIEEFDDDDE